MLLLANIAFLLIAGIRYLPFILVTLFSSFFSARYMGKVYRQEKLLLAESKDKEEKKQIRTASKEKTKRALLLALLVSLGLLVICKYSVFLADNLNLLLGTLRIPQIPTFRMVLPIGISFYTFMAVGYVLDVYWKRYEAEDDLIFFSVFLLFFPHIAQGPIDRYNRFKSQISDGIAFSYQNLTYGAQLMLWGLFKKLVIADRIGIFVDSVYGNWENYTGIIFIVATVAYAIQIYADFSGCIDIVSGISEMMGIKLAENFHHPYFAKTVAEFWRRWHMSLTGWFKDYVYLPVSTSRLVKNAKKTFRAKWGEKAELLIGTSIPILVVWVLTGIWHGAAWNYVMWGLYYGVLMVLSNAFADFNARLTVRLGIRPELFSWRLFQMIRTFAITCFGRVLFRVSSLRGALTIYGRMFSGLGLHNILGSKLFSYGLNLKNILLLAVSVVIMWAVDILQEHMCIRDALAKEHLVFRWILLYGCILAIALFGMYGPGYDAASFIYEQF